MLFEIGHYYQHSTNGPVFHMITKVHTFFYGEALLAEDSCGDLHPVGMDEDAAVNWHEVSGWPRSVYTENDIPDPEEPVIVEDI